MAINIITGFNSESREHLDKRSGPYESIAAANAAIPASKRFVGLEVDIITGGTLSQGGYISGTVKTYVYTGGIADTDLVEKTPQFLNENDFASNSTTQAPTQASVKAYVDNYVNTKTATTEQTLTFADPLTIALDADTNYLTLTLTANTTLSTVSGVIVGKEYQLHVGTDGQNSFPWQITFGAGYSFNDGVEPLLKNNDTSKKDIIKFIGISSTKLQITDVIYGS